MANGLGLRKTSDAQSRAGKLPRLPSFKVFHAVAVTTVCALILVGCTPEQKPTDTPSVSASSTVASSAPSSTSVPPTTAPATSAYQAATKEHKALNVPVPVLPEKAKEFSKAGLEAFAKYWFATLTYLYETGDSKPLDSVTTSACETCANAKSTVQGWYSTGGWIVGGQMILSAVNSKFQKAPDGGYQAVVLVRQQQVVFIDASSKVDETKPFGVAQANVVMTKHDGKEWRAYLVQIIGA